MTTDIKNLAASGLLVAIGLGFGMSAIVHLDIGTAFRMGPGYFPLVLAGFILIIGVIVGINAILRPIHTPTSVAPVRAIGAIIAAPIIFGLTIRGGGFVPAVGLTAVIACAAAQGLKIRAVVAITAGITLFCLAVFFYGLGLPVRLFGPWFGF